MKTKENILDQVYITPKDLRILVPTMGLDKCRKIIGLVQEEMREKGYFVPQTTPRLALTKLVKKKLGI